ncbi:ATP-binding protein [Brevibacillus dissolubilis]|uniref:ATP-binding protein n=1 Tax=Brevibacillus dissolubilis TaxID=1844116 RepID=UPI00159BD727|nr:ATP-binding protein [Brevibacillus dissolubilis]
MVAMVKKRKSLAYRILMLIGIGMFVFVVLMISAYFGINHFRKQIVAKIDDYVIIQQRADKLHDQYNAVALAFRGHLAFGKQEFLDEANRNRATFGQMLGAVKQDAAQSVQFRDEKVRLLDHVETNWRDYESLLEKSTMLKQQGDMASIYVIASERGTPALRAINSDLQQINELYQLELDQMLKQKESYDSMELAIPVVMLVGSFLSGLLMVRFLRRDVVDPIMAMERNVQQIRYGHYVFMKESDREDEIGMLEQGFNHMVRELEMRHQELEDSNVELISQRDTLESQNEEIMAQQIELEDTLGKLTNREKELELITEYQEKLTGYVELLPFFEGTFTSLLQALDQDAAMVLLHKPTPTNESRYEVVYSVGYPASLFPRIEVELYGKAARIFTEKKTMTHKRTVSEMERGVHLGYEYAIDQYFPLLDDQQQVYGFILMTNYQCGEVEEARQQLSKGLVKQFSLALFAQLMNEERRNQSAALAHLNDELTREQQNLEEQRDLIRSILESTHEGIVMCDLEGRVVFANQRMEEVVSGNLVGSLLTNALAGLPVSSKNKGVSMTDIISQFIAGEHTELQERFTLKLVDDKLTHFELYANQVSDEAGSETRGFLFVFRDRTDEEKVDELKNEFVSIVSHELRTPLATVLGFMEILLHRQLTVEKQRKYMEIIYKEANRLSNLINDFLDLQRMESGKQVYHFTPLEMTGILSDVMEQWRGKEAHEIKLVGPTDPVYVHGDHDRVTQVLHNLISNAVKYSPGAEQVDLSVRVKSSRLLIDVTDYGLGIPEESQENIFTKFYRVDNSDRRQIGGTGLGLAIVKEIVEAHGGSIRFVSQVGRGTTFTVDLPVYDVPDVAGKIVILEDDDNLTHMIEEALQRWSLPTVQLHSAEEAILSLRNHQSGSPLLCIVDIQLKGPKLGWEFISELNQNQYYASTPVIVTSVIEPPSHYQEKASEKFVRKPFSVERLLAVVQQLMKQQAESPDFVFPVQDELAITESLREQGLEVTDIKVNEDFIEVDVKKRDNFE